MREIIESNGKIMYSLSAPITYREDENVHACYPMMNENRRRALLGKSHVYIFRDFGESIWTLVTRISKLGVRFQTVSRCPYCERKL